MTHVIIHRAGEERKNHDYVARVPVGSKNGKTTYRYFYTDAAYKAYLNADSSIKDAARKSQSLGKSSDIVTRTQSTGRETTKSTVVKKKSVTDIIGSKFKKMGDDAKKSVDNFFTNAGLAVEKKVEAIPEKLNTTVNKAKKAANDFIEGDDENIYDINKFNYDKKIQKVAESPEWKAIVERKDPEYVKKNSDGTETYLIDDYLAKKKQPITDILDDIVTNRPITVNKIEKDALVAGLKGHIISTITLGAMAVGVGTKALIEKCKLGQGSYNDEIKEMTTTINNGAKFVEETIEVAGSVSAKDVEQTVKVIQNSQAVKSEVNEVADKIREDDIISAARLIMSSDNMPDGVKETEAFQKAEKALSNLSQEEIAMLNILISKAMKG